MANILCTLITILLAHLVLLLEIGPVRGEIPAIIVFGDSTVDAGNNNFIPTVARSNFEPYGRDLKGKKPTGRFSNGRIAPDFISEAMGLKPLIPAYLDPAYNISDFAVGVTFASAGSGFDNATSDVLSVIPLWRELEYFKEYQKRLKTYLGEEKASQTISQALYLISCGTNDFVENYYVLPRRSSQYTVSQYGDFLIGIAHGFIEELYRLGARKISLGGLAPMGCMPLERTTNFVGGRECINSYNVVAVNFNRELNNLVMKVNSELPGVNVVFSNPYGLMMSIIKKPSLYGFDVTSSACCATGMFEMGYACNRNNPFTCTNADKYVFWDAFHPTQKTNQIVAIYAVKNILNKFM